MAVKVEEVGERRGPAPEARARGLYSMVEGLAKGAERAALSIGEPGGE